MRTRDRSYENESPNLRQRQVPRADESTAATPQGETARNGFPGTNVPAPDAMSMQQLLVFITQQQQYQAQIQAQMQAQMQKANDRFELLLTSRSEHRKKDPPVYEGKYGEDIELWIFTTEQYYANRRSLMEADSSDFVTMISSNLGKSVIKWYRAFVTVCEHVGMHATWSLFKNQLRARFRPKDFEYDLRERLSRLKQTASIHEYVSKFQDLLSQTETAISEMEKRFYFQNGLREETAKKIKEESPCTLQQAIEIASNFEFALYSGKPPRTPPKPVSYQNDSGSRSLKPKQHNKRFDNKKGKNDDWRKSAKCNNCGEVGHISPQCKKSKNKKANRFMSGSVYAFLEVKAKAYVKEDQKQDDSIFIDNGSSLDGVIDELVKKLDLEVTEHELMKVDLGYDQVVYRPRRTVDMNLQIPGFSVTSERTKSCLSGE